ncbi:hypothetical protein SAMN02910369_02758 [Lachnospiraceae bacterium NE2001]|nr:hypothetical protein SAMN02910369_02758 [Lachnospiraceae bacterium NE2001]
MKEVENNNIINLEEQPVKQPEGYFVGKGDNDGDREYVWGRETAMLAYQLNWMNKIGKAFFPKEYESEPAFQNAKKLLEGDNFTKFNFGVQGVNHDRKFLQFGVNNIKVENELKEESVREAKECLAGIQKFYQSRKGDKQCEVLAKLSDTSDQKQLNLMMMTGTSPYGDTFLNNLVKEPNTGFNDAPAEGDTMSPAEKKALVDYKKSVLNKIYFDALEMKCLKEKSAYLDSKEFEGADKNNNEIISKRNKIRALGEKEKKEKKLFDDLFAPKEGELSDKEVSELLIGENDAFKAGWKPGEAKIMSFAHMIGYDIANADISAFRMGRNGVLVSDEEAERGRKKMLGDFKKLYTEIKTKANENTPESKTEIVSMVDSFIKKRPALKRKTHWEKNRKLIEEAERLVRLDRADYREAAGILRMDPKARVEKLISLKQAEDEPSNDVLDEYFDIVQNLKYDNQKALIREIANAKAALMGQLVDEATKVRPELGESYLSAIASGKFGDLAKLNKDSVNQKMAARLAIAGNPEIAEKITALDNLLADFDKKINFYQVKDFEKEIIEARPDYAEHKSLYEGIEKRDVPDPEIKDVRLVVDYVGKSDRIAVVLSNEEKNRNLSLSRAAHVTSLNMLDDIHDMSDIGYTYLNKLRLEDQHFNQRMSEDDKYAKLCNSLSSLAGVSCHSTPNQIRLALINVNLAVNEMQESLNAKEQNHTITPEETRIKAAIGDLNEQVLNRIQTLGTHFPNLSIPDAGNKSYAEAFKVTYESFKKNRYGHEELKRYIKEAQLTKEALDLVKEKAAKALKDMNADKSGNSWQFNEMRDALLVVKNLSVHNTPDQIHTAIERVQQTAKLYVEKSDKQFHPFGEPKRTTIADNLQNYYSDIMWPADKAQGRIAADYFMRTFRNWMDPTESLYEQTIQMKTENLDTMRDRVESAVMWQSSFLREQTPVAGKLAGLIVPADQGAAAEPIEAGDDYKFGQDKARDKALLAQKLRDVNSITKNMPVKDVIKRLRDLKNVAENVYKTNTRTLVEIDRNQLPEIANAPQNNNRPIKVKAVDIVKYADQMLAGIEGIELSKTEMNKPLSDLCNDRAKELGRVDTVARDAFKASEVQKKTPKLRHP